MNLTSAPRSRALSALLLASLSLLATACGGSVAVDGGLVDGGRDASSDAPVVTVPTVLSNVPASGASSAAINTSISVTFSEPMTAASLSATSFVVTSGSPAVLVPGAIVYDEERAVFWPASALAVDTMHTVTITDAALSAAGIPLAADHVWSFTTGNTRAPGTPVDLGSAGDFVILAKSGVSTVPSSSITGDVGLSPAAATFLTGFSLTADATTTFSTSAQVTGRLYAADDALPTPTHLTTAVSDMELAFVDASSRAPDVTELGAGNVGGLTIASGVYRWGTGLLIPADVTLTGTATDVWIFQVAGDLTLDSGASVVLTGGALPQNVFWQVSGFTDVGTTAHLSGVLLCATAVTLRTGASLDGRILAQTQVALDGSTVTEPTE